MHYSTVKASTINVSRGSPCPLYRAAARARVLSVSISFCPSIVSHVSLLVICHCLLLLGR